MSEKYVERDLDSSLEAPALAQIKSEVKGSSKYHPNIYNLARYNTRAVQIVIGIICLVILLGGSTALLARPSSKDTTNGVDNKTSKFNVGSIPLSGVTPGTLQLGQADHLSINGRLVANDGLVITPGAAPTTGVMGQLYFDQNTAKPYYYNGTSYQSLDKTSVSSIGGVTGALSVANGIRVNGSQLRLTDDILQAAAAVNRAGGLVSSVQGQTGQVSFSAGNGIAINGTSFTNTGVLGIAGATGNVSLGRGLIMQGGALKSSVSLAPGSPNLTITEDGNGNYTISDSLSATTQVVLGPVAPQTDSSNNPSISINKTGAGNLLQLASNGTNKFTVDQNGAITLGTIDYSKVVNRPATTVTDISGFSGSVALGAGLGIAGNTLSNTGVTGVTGTANQVIVSGSTGNVTISLPQDLAVTSSPSFAGLNLSANLVVGGTSTLNGSVSITGASTLSVANGATNLGGSLAVAAAVNLANTLAVSGNTTVGGTLGVTGASTFTGLGRFDGGVQISNNSSFNQIGTGTVSTGTGNVNLNGSTAITGSNSFTTGTGSVTLGSLGTGVVQSNASGILTSGAIDRNGSAYFTGTLNVANGGTGATSFTSNGLLYGNGSGSVQASTAGTDGQVVIANALGVPVFTTISGDTSVTNSGATTVNKLQNNTLTLSSLTNGQVIQYNGSALVNGLISNNNLQSGNFGNITGVGTLTSGSISSGFGTISTGNNITTTATLQGATVVATGALQGNTLSLNGGTFAVTSGGAITAVTGITTTGGYTQSGAGANSFSGATTVGGALTTNGGITDTGNFAQTGAGTLSTGTGAVSLNGNTTVSGANTFTVGTGATLLGGGLGVTGSATFANNISVQGNATVGTAGTSNGLVSLTNSTNSNLVTIQGLAPTGVGTATIRIPSIAGGTSDNVCLVSLGNCAGSGTGVTASAGAAGYVPVFTASQNITSSIIYQTGTSLGVNTNTPGAFALNVQGGNVNFSGSATVGSGLSVTGATSLAGATSVAGANTFTVGTGATSLGGTLGVGGVSTFSGNVVVSGASTLTVGTGATALGGTLSAAGNTTLGGTLGVTGASTLSSTLGVTGATTLGSTLAVTGASTLNGNVNITGANTLNVGTGATTLGGTLAVTGTSTLTGNVSAGGTVTATGLVTANGGITDTGNFSQTGAGTFSTGAGANSLNGNTSVTGTNTFNVGTGATTLGGSLGVTGTSTFTGATTHNGNVSIAGTSTLSVGTGATTLGGTLGVTGLTTLNGGATIAGATSVTGATTINTTGSANTTVGNATGTFALTSAGLNITAAGAISGATTITASGAISAATATNTINGLVINAGALSAITGYSQTSGNFAQSGAGTFSTGTGAVSLNGNTSVTGTNTFNVGTGASSLGGTLSVTGTSTHTGAATFNGGITDTGNFSQTGAGTFSTGTGAVSLNGVTTVASTLAVQGASATIGTTTVQGSVVFNSGAGAGNKTGTVQVISSLAQNTIYTLPDPGAASATICLSTGNCAGAGTGITGAGTAGNIAKFNAAQNIVNSGLSESGTTLTYAGNAVVNANAGFTGNLLDLQLGGVSKVSVNQTGAATIANGVTVTAGGLTVSAGGAAITGNSTITGNLGVSTGLSVAAGGAAITGNSSVTGTFGTSGALTVSAGGANITGNSSVTGTLGVSNTLSVAAGGLSVTGNSTISGTLSSLTGLSSSGTVTFSGLSAVGVVHTNAGGTLSTSAVALGTDTSGNYVSALGALTGLTTTGNTGAGSTPTLSVTYGSVANTSVMGNTTLTVTAGTGLTGGGTITLGTGGTATLNVAYGSTANTAVQGNTTVVCPTGTGNLAGGGNTITLGTGGTCGALSISNSPTFSGNLAVQGATGVSVGVAGTTAGVVNFANAVNANLGTLKVATLGQATTYTLPDPGLANVSICLSTGNCAGSGTSITGSGTNGKIAKFNAAQNVIDSTLSESGTVVTASGSVVIQGTSSLTLGTAGPAGKTGSIAFNNAAGTHTVTLQAPTTDPTVNLAFKLPNADGSNGACLETDGAGNLTFASCTGGAGGGVTSIAGQTGVVTINNTTAAAGAITINNAKADGATQGIAAFNATNFSDNGAGVINTIQNIATTSTPTFGGLSLTSALTVANGGTGASTLAANGILYGNGTGTVQATAAAANSILATNGINVPSLTSTLPTAVQGNITSTGALTAGSIASGFGSISTTNAITTTAGLQGGTLSIASGAFAVNGSGAITAVTGISTTGGYTQSGAGANTLSGATTIQSTLAVQGANLTVGASAQQGSLILNSGAGAGNKTGTLQVAAALAQNTVYTLPDPGVAAASICLSTGNCAGSGTGVTATAPGTANYISKFTAGQNIASSQVFDNGSFVGINTTTNNAQLSTVVSGTGAVGYFQGAASGSTTLFTIKSTGSTGDFINFVNSSATTVAKVTATGDIVAANANFGGTLGVTGNATLSGTLAVIGASTLTGALTANGGITDTGAFSQTGTGTFGTGTGAVSLNGATSVTGTNTFAVGTGATTLGGTLGVTGTTALTGALTANAGTFNGNVSIAGTSTLSVGTGATTLGGTLGVTGLATLNGGATISGATSVTGATTINTTGTANTSIGNATGTFALTSAGLNISAAGAISGATTISASGAISAATATNTINGLVINAGALSAITGYSQTSGSFSQTGTGTFGTGTGAVSLNGATSVTGTNTFNVGTGATSLGGTLAVTGTTALTGALTANAATFNGSVGINGANTLTVGTGATTLGGTLAVTGASTFNGGVTSNGSVTISGTNTLTTGTGAVTLGALGAGIVQSSAGGLLSSGAVDRNSASLLSGTLSVANGGSGNTSYTNTGVLFYNGTNFVSTAASTGAQCLISTGAGVAPTWGSCTNGTSGVTSLNSFVNAVNVVGTANQVIVSNAANTVTLSTPQDINTTSAVTFGKISVTTGINPGVGTALIYANNTNAGPTGNLADFQTNGTSKFSVSAAGNVTAAGNIASSGNISATGSLTGVGVNGGTGLIQGTGGLTIGGTITLSNLNTAGVVHTNASGVLSTSAVVLGTDTSGAYVQSVGAGTGTTVGGTALNPTVNVTYGSAANTAAQGNTAFTFSPSGNLQGSLSGTAGAGFTTTTLALVNSPSFSGTLTVQGAGGATIGSTANNGVLKFLDGTADGFTASVQLAGALGAAQTYSLPTTGGTFCLSTNNCNYQTAGSYELTTGTDFIRNQVSQQAAANFNIAGTGVATTLQAGTFDTAAAAALNIGTTNATGLSVSKAGVTTAINGALTVAQATTLSGATTVSNTLNVGAFATTLGGTLAVTGNSTMTGSVTANGGLSVTGATTINTTGTANTAIGNATGTFTVASAALNVTAAGAISGATTINASGAITAATSANTINGVVINAGALSSVTGITTNGSYTQSGVGANALSGATTFSAAGTALTVNNNATITGTGTIGTLSVGAGGITDSGTLTVSGTSTSSIAGQLNLTGTGTGLNVQNNTIIGGTLVVQGSGGITIGVAGTTVGNLALANATSTRTVIIQGLNPSGVGNATVQVPSIAGGATDQVCLQTLANCTGTGGSVSTSGGTQNYITKYTNAGATQLGNSLLFDNGSFVGVNTQTNNGQFSVAASGTQAAAYLLGATTGTATIETIKNSGSTGNFIDFINSTAVTVAKIDASGNLTAVNGSFTGNVAVFGTTTSTGLLTANGGATVAGTTSVTGVTTINTTGTNNTSIGNATGTLTLTSAGLNVSGAGALTGVTTLAASGNITTTGSVTAVGLNSGTGLIQGTGGLTITGTTTLSSLNSVGVVHTNASGVLATGLVALGTETSGAYVQSVGAGTGTTVGGTASVPTVNVTYGSAANTAAQGNTAFTFSPSGNLQGSLSGTAGAGFTTTTLALVNNPSFTGLVTANGGLSVGSTTVIGQAKFTDGTADGFAGTIQLAGAIGANQTYSLPTTGGTFCLSTNNCNYQAAGSYALTTDTTNFIRNQSSQQAASNFNISGTGTAATSLLTPTIDVAAAATLNIGTATATSLSVSKAGVTTTVNGALTVTQATTLNGAVGVNNTLTVGAFATSLGSTLAVSGATTLSNTLTVNGTQFTNNGSTLNSAAAIANLAGGGAIGTAVATVDVKTAFSVAQTTTSQTLSLPSPTTTTAGRLAYVVNTGTASFIMHGATIAAGAGQDFIWNGSAWIASQIATVAGTGLTMSGNVINSAAATSVTNDTNITGSIASNILTLGFTGNLSVLRGGTGSTTAAGALVNLGAAARGANSDITSITGLTTALSVAEGGTGNNTFATNGSIYYDGTKLVSTAASTGAQCLITVSAGVAPTWGSCTNGSSGVSSVNAFTGAVTIVGTANQVNVANATNTVTLSLPQDINTTSAVSFGKMSVVTATNPSAGSALIFANNTNGAPTGNLIDVQVGAVSKFNVSSTGAVVATGSLTGVGVNSGTGLIQGSGGLTITGTTTLSSLNSVGVVHTNASGVLATGLVALGTETSGAYVQSVGAGTGTTVGGTASVPTVNVTYGSAANNAAAGANTFTCPSGGSNLSGGGTVVTIGTSGTACAALAVVNAPSFSGLITSTANTTGLALTGAPAASATSSLAQLGSAIAGGNAVANGGTYLGLNAPAAGAGSAADFLNFQLNGVSKLLVTNAGAVTATSFAGDGSALTNLNGTNIATGTVANARLVNAGALTVTAGTGLSGGGSVALGGTTTLNLANTTVVANSYGSASSVATFTVNGQGQLTTAASTPIAIAATQITSGNYVATLGALTGLTTTGNSGTGSNPTLAVAYGSAANNAAAGANTFTCPSGGSNLSGGGTVVTIGTSGTACAALAVVNAPSFSGLITSTANTTGLALTGAPAASATSSLAQLGSAIAGGNAVANGGTYLGINLPASGAGSAADFLNFQVNGASKLTVSSAGQVFAGLGFGVNGVSGANTTCSGGQFLQNQVVSGGIVTGGTCAAAGAAGGATSVGAIDGGTYSANGGAISGGVLYLQGANSGKVGLVTTGAQTYDGLKTFSSKISVGVNGTSGVETKLAAFSAAGAGAQYPSIELQSNGTAGLKFSQPNSFLDSVIDNNYASGSTLQLAVRGTTGLTLNNGGNVSVGNSNNTYKLDVTGDINTSAYIRQAGLVVLNTTTATGNVFVGPSAGNTATTSINNTAVGNSALTSLAGSIDGNSAFGYSALKLNVTGDRNTAIGANALQIATGAKSTAVGYNAGNQVTSGTLNSYLGYKAGDQDPDGFTSYFGLTNSSAFGAYAQVQKDNSLVLGGAGANQVNVGIGTTTPLNPLSVMPVQYSTGTASQSGTTVTGVGTTFTAAMVGSQFVWSNGPIAPLKIVSVTDATHLVVDVSQTVASMNYRIHYLGLQVTSAGNVGIGTSAPGSLFQVGSTASNRFGVDNTGLVSLNTSGTLAAATSSSYGLTLAQGGGYLTLGSDTSYSYLQSWNSRPLLINGQGNAVGVGTTSITAGGGLLQVAGGVQAVLSAAPAATAALNGTIVYDSTAGKFKIYEGGVAKIVCNTTDLGCGSGGGGITTVGTYSTTNTAAGGATISGSTITFQDATASAPGMVSNGTQTLGGNKTFLGNTGIGVASSTPSLLVGGTVSSGDSIFRVSGTLNSTGINLLGMSYQPTLQPGNGFSTDAMYFNPTINAGTGITIPNYKGIEIATPVKTGTGTITNSYGLFINDPSTIATNNYALYVNGGASQFNGAVALQPSTDTVGALKVSDSTSTQVFNVSTATNTVAIGTVAPVAGAKLLVTASASTALIANTTGAGALLELQKSGSDVLSVGNTGNVSINPSATTNNAFQVQNLSMGLDFTVSTFNDSVSIGNTAPTGAAKLLVYAQGTETAIVGNQTSTGSLLQLQKSGADLVNVGNTGATLFKNSVNSTAALQVQNAAGTSLFNADSTNSVVTVGSLATASATITSAGQSDAYATNLASLAITTHAAGNVVLVSIMLPGSTQTVSTVSGGNVTSWTRVTSFNDATPNRHFEIWQGITNATGSSTISFTYGATPGGVVELTSQEFTAGSSASWNVVTSNTLINTANNTNELFPSLTSNSGVNQAYWGFMRIGGAASAGNTPGFTYRVTGNGNLMTYNAALAASTAYQPNGTSAPAASEDAIAVIVQATNNSFAGGLNVNGTGTITSNSASALVIQNAASNTIFGVDASANTALLGQASMQNGSLKMFNQNNANTVSIVSGVTSSSYILTLPTAVGSAGQCVTVGSVASNNAQLAFGACGGGGTHAKSIVIPAEYSGAVLDAAADSSCAAANSGSMTSGLDSANRQNYYQWTTTNAAAQCYDVVVQVPIPSDSNGTAPTLSLSTYASTAAGTVMAAIYDTAGTATTAYPATYASISSSATMTNQSLSALSGTYTAGGYMTVKLRLTSTNPANVRIGNLTLNYNTSY